MDCSFTYLPEDIIENPDSAEVIRRDGFVIVLETQECGEAVAAFLRNAPYVSEMAMEQLETENTAAEEAQRGWPTRRREIRLKRGMNFCVCGRM
ncbi:hypothetical protein A3844_18710 [Paenibacillus helianthi]|uniref:Uncharacterized protein n=2 Tax=Paenibacillus helianthi TaxID=1349432 RepID=A0ABX3EK63_9BACL|nr:hypothetical protein A3844_18710 [Paenibacillus helianthi]